MFIGKQPTQLLRQQAGDTIIEVLIAIAVVSLVLVGAYASTRTNVQVTQDTQEHAQAQKLVEGQVELLRTQSAALAGNTCFANGIPASGASCTVTPDGPTAANYKLSITPPSGGLQSYTVSANWDNTLGGISNVTMNYKPN